VTPRPERRLVVAPAFHVAADWAARFRLGPDGRGLSAAELAALLPDPARPIECSALHDHLCLFRLPQHLLSAWWRVAEAALEGLDAFVGEVAEFLAFKGLPIPDGAVCDVLVSAPGRPSLQGDGPGLGVGLWGVINLGAEPSALLFADLRPACPVVCLAIEPGEGLRFPAGGLLVDGCTLGQQEPGVWLRIGGERG
jgi:hypothetical protein